MKRFFLLGVGLTIGVVTSIAVLAGAARTSPEAQPNGQPIGPRMAKDSGAGELLVVVLGGVYGSRSAAEDANATQVFGDLQGYYVVPVAQFQGFREQLGAPGDLALVSVFRTLAGAEAFVALARGFGAPATILPTRVRSLGGLYAGLGQEAAPDGSGPLVGPIAESLP